MSTYSFIHLSFFLFTDESLLQRQMEKETIRAKWFVKTAFKLATRHLSLCHSCHLKTEVSAEKHLKILREQNRHAGNEKDRQTKCGSTFPTELTGLA